MTDLREAMRAASVSRDLTAVDVPEWGRKVYIRKLAVRDQMALEKMDDAPTIVGLKTLALALVREDGSQELDPESEEDMQLLLGQPLAIIVPLLTEAAKQNGLTTEEVKEAVETFGKAPEQRSFTG